MNLINTEAATIRMQAVKAGHRPSGWSDAQLIAFRDTGAVPAFRETAVPATIRETAVPATISAPAQQGGVEAAIAALFSTLTPALDEQRVIDLIQQHAAPQAVEQRITLEVRDTITGEIIVEENVHAAVQEIIVWVRAGIAVNLVGPAGSGKTTACEQVARHLGLAFRFTSAVRQEHKLLGFIDAGGTYHRTAFRDAYELGGLFLFDEIDASSAEALVAFNSALANGICDFPDGPVRAHADFRAIAAANTFGRGADRQYVGRNQLDAATLDRFAVVEFDYDAALEQRLAANAFRSAGGHDEAILSNWVRFVQRVREIVAQQKVRHVVSPRASIMGARFIAAGGGTESAANALIWKGLSADQRAAITAAC